MQMTLNRRAVVVRSAVFAPLYLIGSFFVGMLIASAIFVGLPGHVQDSTKTAVAIIPGLGSLFAGGALWGRAMARLIGAPNERRSMLVGALGYGTAVLLAVLTLTQLEQLFVEQRRLPDLPIHVIFTLLFVPAASIVAATGALALGVALRGRSSLAPLTLGSGLAAGMAFLVWDLFMDAIGYRVGAPGAAERATMLTVMFTGNAVASLAAGAVIGLVLSRRPDPLVTFDSAPPSLSQSPVAHGRGTVDR